MRGWVLCVHISRQPQNLLPCVCSAQAYVHMECDGWLPWKLSQEWVPESDVFSSSPRKLSSRHKIEAWSTVRMLPGTTRTRFFFQLLLRGMGHRYAHKKHNTVIRFIKLSFSYLSGGRVGGWVGDHIT